jgi:hypothetical protein
MNKRGVLIFEIGVWLVRIVMVLVIIGGVALQIRTYINAKVNLDVAEPALLVQVLGTSTTFLYRDAAGTYQRAVSVERFKTADLASAFDYGEHRRAAAKLVLQEQDGKELKTIYLNEPYYKVLAAQKAGLLRQLLEGPWLFEEVVARPITVTGAERQWPVLLTENKKERAGILRIEVLQPR